MPNPNNPFRKAVMGTNEFEDAIDETVVDIEIALELWKKTTDRDVIEKLTTALDLVTSCQK